MKILVTGATGYIGGRLVPILSEKKHAGRVLVCDARRLEGREWYEKVKVFDGDLENREEIVRAAKDVDDESGILGRDVLNRVSILFDGLNLTWQEIIERTREI